MESNGMESNGMESNGETRVGNMTVVEKDDVITGIARHDSPPGIIVNPQTLNSTSPISPADPRPSGSTSHAVGDMACGRSATKVEMHSNEPK